MRKVITVSFAFAALAGCASAPTPGPRPMVPAASSAPGGPDASSAVRGFMDAAKLQNVQSLALWWGDASGPSRDAIAKEELQKRELIMLKCLKHDRYEVIGDAPSEDGARDILVSMTYRGSDITTHMTVVPGPHGRWFVENVDLQALHPLCAAA